MVAARPDDYWHEGAALLAAGDRRTLFVADDGGRWRGVAGGLLADDSSAVEVIAVWVDPLYRGRGYGTALVDRVVSWGMGRGARRAYLWVHERNGPAIALYSRLGFLDTDLRKPLGTGGHRMQLFMERARL
jgi:GNAT superfamily N-acetyltransferase